MTKQLPANLKETFCLDPASPSGLSKRTKSEKPQPVGWLERHGYWRIRFKGQKYWAHRVCYYLYTGTDFCGLEIDHIDGNTQNNCPENLRVCSISLNQANQKLSQRNTSGYKGVTWKTNRNKWAAQISCASQYFYLGLYDSALDAARAYDAAALEMFGNHAKTNGMLNLV
jgi:hypothetical protein